jgi:outer membrane protein OmpA-like peptidoglycan-associated protein
MNKTHQTRILLALAAALTLSACQTTDPYTGEQKTTSATKGAAIGAAAGAAIGLITGDDSRERKKRALILGGVGALGGGAVGAYMDQQEAKLREQLRGTGVSVTRDGENIILNMPGNVTFATNSADVQAGFYPVLDSVGLVLKEYDKTVVEVAGHTDSTGSDSYNLELSQRRAASVSAYLNARGVVSDRLLSVGYGKARPIATNETAEGRQLNRRVEITVLPLTN